MHPLALALIITDFRPLVSSICSFFDLITGLSLGTRVIVRPSPDADTDIVGTDFKIGTLDVEVEVEVEIDVDVEDMEDIEDMDNADADAALALPLSILIPLLCPFTISLISWSNSLLLL